MIYLNILAVVVGAAGGLVLYFAGEEFWFTSVTISGILYAGYLAIWGHLQHSQLWISWTGLPGRLVLSPAHHQIHHSNNPIHFDKNFGAGLAIWDWLFGTLHVPQKKDEHLHYGTHNDEHLKRLIPSVLYPILYSAKRLLSIFWSNNSTPPVAEPEPASQAEVSIPDEGVKELTYEYDRRG
jgi:sterol desaturase/sphingolipid hydroxylase (fatty acid hydroxylase superfamily)